MSYPTEKLCNHIQVLSGFAFKSKDFSDAGIPVIKIKNITPPSVSLIDLSYVSEEIADKNEKFILRYNDVLIALTGSHINQMASVVGRVAKVKYDDFVYYYLSQDKVKIELASKAGGAANQANISPTDIKNLMIPFPEITVQRKISAILRTYDDLIENNQKQIKLLEEAAQRLYKEWFVDLRFPGYETTPLVDGIPEGWKERTIADICSRIGAGGTPSRSKDSYWNPAEIKWFKTGELLDCWLLDSGEKISKEGLTHSAAKLFPPNTVLMAIYASPTLGRLGILSNEAACNQAALCLVAKDDVVSWQWLYQKLYGLRDEFNAVAKGAGQQNISADVVKKMVITVPSKECVDQYTCLAAPIFDRMRALQVQNAKLREARDRLLPKLMSGEIEV